MSYNSKLATKNRIDIENIAETKFIISLLQLKLLQNITLD